MPKVWLYSVEQEKATEVTDGWYSSGSPTFSGDGKYLFFVSARDFNPTYSNTEWNHAYRDMSRVYFVTLAKATPNPLRPKLDDEPDAKKEDKKDGPPEVKVDPRMARSWATLPSRGFAATTVDLGFVYLRPRLSLGYGRPFTQWIGVDANPIASQAGLGAYGGLRIEVPHLDFRFPQP
jgi:hypothetical protein